MSDSKEQFKRANIFQIIKKSGEAIVFDEMKLQRSIEGSLVRAGIEKNPIAAQLVTDVIKKLEEELSYRENISTLDIREAVEISLLERGLTSVASIYHDFDNPDAAQSSAFDKIDTNIDEDDNVKSSQDSDITIAEIIDKKKFIPVVPNDIEFNKSVVDLELLPDERSSVTYRFNFAGIDGYVTVSLFDSGVPGEILLHSVKANDDINLDIVKLFLTIINTSLRNKVNFDSLISDIMIVMAELDQDNNLENEMSIKLLQHICKWLDNKF